MRFLILACTSLLLAACAGAPERKIEDAAIDPPAHWNSAAAHLDDDAPQRWVAAFNQPTLSALIAEALQHNYDLQAAAARVAAALAQARIEGAGRWPQLAFAPGYQRQRDGLLDPSESGGFSARFDLSWELDLWGRIRAGQRAARQTAQAVLAELRGARLSLAARTAQTWFELAEAQAQAEVAGQSAHDRRTIADLIRERFQRGLAMGLDLRLARTDQANAEAQLADAKNRAQASARRLELLLGRYPAAGIAAGDGLPAPPAALTAGLPAQLLERRPDLAAAFQRLLAADSRLDSAQKALLPRITLTAGGGSAGAALADLADPRAAAWNLALGLAQPLFAGGRLHGEIERSSAVIDAALADYRQTALNAFREVELALAAEQRLREQEAALREAVEQTKASRERAVYAYQHGFIQILTLLDSYRSALDAQSAHLAVRRQLLDNRVNLYLALGGDA